MGIFDKIKQTATDFAGAVDTVMAEPKKAYVSDDRTPFVGFETDENGKVVKPAQGGVHNLTLAGSGVGKSRTVLAPAIMLWDGPVFAVSAKGDLAEMTAEHRARDGGPTYLMDLTGQVDLDEIPAGLMPLVNDPCALLVPDGDGNTDDSAYDLATLLVQVGSMGVSGGKGGGGGDSDFWATLSLGVLACLLQAGAGYPDPETEEWVDGGGIAWVLKAILNPGGDEGDGEDGGGFEFDFDTPSWDTAAMRAGLRDSVHALDIEATKNLDPKQRDSVGINLRVALSSWKKRAIRGGKGSTPFKPAMLEDPTATFYLVSPSNGAGAAAAVSVIEAIVNHWVTGFARKMPKMLMVLDEMPVIAPWKRLREAVGLLRSYGLTFHVAAQHSTQFIARFGKEEADALLAIFPSILIGVGAIEKELLELAAWTAPPSERRVESLDANGRRSSSTDKTETYQGSELLPRHPGEGRLLLRGMSGMKVKLKDYTEMFAD
ncbi:type IV secretion system protein VirD4 [Leucobacter exalbidus]|uniref:Type IV secretion system protein VirD4 n=1 Tax=Leucobacter exalbidus TaxID=662960 RepID=A0A940T2R3_9MICO|nr:type IV secretory system conjugative DNA transfer family protein [Leucobacter exalbidus]MBP1325068.1 type IV secretion system protein VirD4 [Leucobacter exalbidus]